MGCLHPRGKAGLDYFRRRGLTGRIIRRFGLGYSPDSGYALVDHPPQKKGYTQEELLQSDMVRRSKKRPSL